MTLDSKPSRYSKRGDVAVFPMCGGLVDAATADDAAGDGRLDDGGLAARPTQLDLADATAVLLLSRTRFANSTHCLEAIGEVVSKTDLESAKKEHEAALKFCGTKAASWCKLRARRER